MRLNFYALCIIVLYSSFSAYASDSVVVKPASDPLKKLSAKYDRMEAVTWYRSKLSPKGYSSNAFYLYFGKYDTGLITPIRLYVQYYSDSWLFIKHAWVKADDINLDVPQGYSQWKRDNAGGKIWEWIDTPIVSNQHINIINKIVNSKKVHMRFEGSQYYDDVVITESQLKAMREIISVYEEITGKSWKQKEKDKLPSSSSNGYINYNVKIF